MASNSDQSNMTFDGENSAPVEGWRSLAKAVGLVGCSEPHAKLLRDLHRVAPTNAEVLLTGETGVGKELYARFLHMASKVRGNFVALNCGAIPDHLFENELFGHSVGAYTDAKSRSEGLVRAADDGTLFLDEVHRLSLQCQVKLLRLLQEREYRRLGETQLSQAKFRLVCAMNANPASEIAEGRLRNDLFYRMNVVSKTITPLRERTEDVDVLLEVFSNRFSNEYHREHPLRFHLDARLELRRFSWPGNIRQLKHLVQSLACQYPDEPTELRTEDIDLFECNGHRSIGHAACAPQQPAELEELLELPFNEAKQIAVKCFESDYLCNILRKTQGNITKAANLAGKHRRAFFELMRKHGICAEEFKKLSQSD